MTTLSQIRFGFTIRKKVIENMMFVSDDSSLEKHIVFGVIGKMRHSRRALITEPSTTPRQMKASMR